MKNRFDLTPIPDFATVEAPNKGGPMPLLPKTPLVPGWQAEVSNPCRVCGLPTGLHALAMLTNQTSDSVKFSATRTFSGVFSAALGTDPEFLSTVSGCVTLVPDGLQKAQRLLGHTNCYNLGYILGSMHDSESIKTALTLLSTAEWKKVLGV